MCLNFSWLLVGIVSSAKNRAQQIIEAGMSMHSTLLPSLWNTDGIAWTPGESTSVGFDLAGCVPWSDSSQLIHPAPGQQLRPCTVSACTHILTISTATISTAIRLRSQAPTGRFPSIQAARLSWDMIKGHLELPGSSWPVSDVRVRTAGTTSVLRSYGAWANLLAANTTY
jgi:hypothetical protein